MNSIANKGEPRKSDGQTVESDYAIQHPLIGHQLQNPETARALDLLSRSVTYLQDGNESRAAALMDEALEADPSLHRHACEGLLSMAKGCSPEAKGAVYYWLGIHSQYLEDYRQAEAWYAQAAESFHVIGYPKREGRARCNLARMKMKHGDPSGLKEFEDAIALNPADGIAQIDIGIVYLLAGQHEQALDAFAEAVWADPARYGPVVISRLQSCSYTWNEDVQKIGQRIAKKQGMDFSSLSEVERQGILQANRYFEIGNRLFQSRRYQEALDQFEKGKSLSNRFAGNYMGVSMTALQMIEVKAISPDKIPSYLQKAEQNIDECLRIAPANPDYLHAKDIIREYKKKYQGS